jgi:hypothetical protein
VAKRGGLEDSFQAHRENGMVVLALQIVVVVLAEENLHIKPTLVVRV